MRRRTLLLAGPAALLARQATAALPGGTHARLSYAIYAAGLNVVRLQIEMDVTSAGYGMQVALRTTGLYGAFVHTNMLTTVQGFWDGDTVRPIRLESHGIWKGAPHQSLMTWQDGIPDVRLLVPPAGTERAPVPTSMQAHTIDDLSAIALLVRRVQQTGRCDGSTMVFDGRRLSRISVHTVGREILSRTSRSSYSGAALRCDFSGQMLAGFLFRDNPKQAGRPRTGSAWLAPLLPGAPPVPVRMRFQADWFGDAVMYLTGFEREPAARAAEPLLRG